MITFILAAIFCLNYDVVEHVFKSDDDIVLFVQGHNHSSDMWDMNTCKSYHMIPRRVVFRVCRDI